MIGSALLRELERWIAPLRRRVLLTVTRAIVRSVRETGLARELQLELLSGELVDGVEHLQGYGFTARPLTGSEIVAVAIGGLREHLVAVAGEDRRYRPRDLLAGEVGLYNHAGARVTLKSGRVVRVECDRFEVVTPESTLTLGPAGLVATGANMQLLGSALLDLRAGSGTRVLGDLDSLELLLGTTRLGLDDSSAELEADGSVDITAADATIDTSGAVASFGAAGLDLD